MEIVKINEYIASNTDSRIVLLRDPTVIQWIFTDLSFLVSDKQQKHKLDELKILEDKWGQMTLKKRRPDLRLEKQWTNKFGEHVCEELWILQGKNIKSPTKKDGYLPDFETDDSIIEVKTGTYCTTGTAGEKIIGCPFKYALVPELYSKPLKILCIGRAEKSSREEYGNLPGPKSVAKKQKYIEFYKSQGVEFVGITDVLKSLVYPK